MISPIHIATGGYIPFATLGVGVDGYLYTPYIPPFDDDEDDTPGDERVERPQSPATHSTDTRVNLNRQGPLSPTLPDTKSQDAFAQSFVDSFARASEQIDRALDAGAELDDLASAAIIEAARAREARRNEQAEEARRNTQALREKFTQEAAIKAANQLEQDIQFFEDLVLLNF